MPHWSDRRLLDLLRIEHPIIQAPMAGVTTPELVAAVSNAGGLGSLGCALLAPDELRAQIRATRAATNRPYNLNFFVHRPPASDPERERRMRERLAGYYAKLEVEPPETLRVPFAPFGEAQLEVVLQEKVPVVSFHFGLPEAEHVRSLKEAGVRVLSSATTVEEALWLEERGVDVVIAQGYEAGGHRGTFLVSFEAAQIGTFALVPQVADAVRCPVVAAGGIMDGRGVAAALLLGASGAQLGTAFLLCPEAATNPIYRRALRSEMARHTQVTRAFSGRPARAIASPFVREMAGSEPDALDFPLQHAFTRPLQQASASMDSPDYLSLWAGQGAPLARPTGAAALVELLIRESQEAFAKRRG